MPVHFIADFVSSRIPTEYYASLGAAIVAASFLKTWATGPKLLEIEEAVELQQHQQHQERLRKQGKPVDSDLGAAPPALRDLHGRVVLVASGAFTPLGVVTLSSLAHRGAQIVALTPTLRSPRVLQMVSLLRSSTNNELIYAEQCDLSDLHSVSAFASKWNEGDPVTAGPSGGGKGGARRLDVLLFLPSEESTYSLGQGVQPSPNHPHFERAYVEEVLARFHLLNALLPSILLLPPERDIRIVSAISPWYGAGVHSFADVPLDPTAKAYPLSTAEPWRIHGATSLRWYALMRELQRRLHLLAEADTRPRDKLPGIDPQVRLPTATGTAQAGGPRRRSNVSVLCISTGFERNQDVLSFLAAPRTSREVDLYPPSTEDDDDDTDADQQVGDEPSLPLRQTGDATPPAQKLREAIDPRRRPPVSAASAAALETLHNLPASLSSSSALPSASASPSLQALAHRLSLLLRYLLLLLLWPPIWLLSKSPATASNALIWATTKRIESEVEFWTRIEGSGGSSALVEGEGGSGVEGQRLSAKERARREIASALRQGEMYRDGRVVRPVLPESVCGGDGKGWARLWEEEERRVESVVGKVKRPGGTGA